MNTSNTISCPEHGEQQTTYVCKHLVQSLNTKEVVGYFCSTKSPDTLRPDAWCIDCEEVSQESNGWNEESEKFAGISILCGCCYDETKRINDIF